MSPDKSGPPGKPGRSNKHRNLPRRMLMLLMLAVTALTCVTLLISVYVFRAQGKLTDEILSSYVMDVADTFARGLPADGGPPGLPGQPSPPKMPPGWGARRGRMFGDHHMPRRGMFFRGFMANPSINSGGLLLLDSERRPIGGSEGAEDLLSLWGDGVTPGEPTTVTGRDGIRYSLAVRALERGGYVLVAASKTNLMNPYSRLWNFWLISVMISSAAVLAGIGVLWRYFVLPIRGIVEEIGGLRWGSSMPEFSRGRVPPLHEVGALEAVIERSAADAISEKSLRSRYVADIVQAQEDARGRLARELHDGPLQSVVAAIKRIQLASRAASPEAARDGLDEAERVSQYAANEIRDYCDELSPSWAVLGLESALEELAGRLSAAHGVAINVSADDEYRDMPEECSLALIRILQEAVSNSVRHGGASAIDARLEGADDRLVFTVTDDGRGFGGGVFSEFSEFGASGGSGESAPSERLRLLGRRGLSNMHERAQMLGGKLEISPAPNDPENQKSPGARVSVTIPRHWGNGKSRDTSAISKTAR